MSEPDTISGDTEEGEREAIRRFLSRRPIYGASEKGVAAAFGMSVYQARHHLLKLAEDDLTYRATVETEWSRRTERRWFAV